MLASENRSIVQVSVDPSLKKKIEFLRMKRGHDSNASLIRYIIRNYFDEVIKNDSKLLSDEAVKSIIEAETAYKTNTLHSASSAKDLIEQLAQDDKTD